MSRKQNDRKIVKTKRKRKYSPKPAAQHPCEDFNREDLTGKPVDFEDEDIEEEKRQD